MPKALFNITYTCPEPPRYLTGYDRAKYIAERNFYNLSAEYNYFSYILNGEKVEKNKDAESYFTRTGSGLFDLHGNEYSDSEIEELKKKLKNTGSIIWHGFISFDQETSLGFTSMAQAEKFMKQTFGAFLQRTHLKPESIEGFAALHTDHSHHNHIHFAFFEKDAKRRDKTGRLTFTKKGNISQEAIDNYMVSANMYLDENAHEYYTTRDEAMSSLGNVRSDIIKGIHRDMKINMAIDALIAKFPKGGRLQYNADSMAALRPDIDKLAQMLINSDPEVRKAHIEVLKQFARIEKSIKDTVNSNKMVYVNGQRLSKAQIKEIEDGDKNNLSTVVDPKKIDYLPKLQSDYNARLGNIVLGMCKEIQKGDYRERKKKLKVNATIAKIAARRQYAWRKQLERTALKSIGAVDKQIQMDFMKSVQEIEKEKAAETK